MRELAEKEINTKKRKAEEDLTQENSKLNKYGTCFGFKLFLKLFPRSKLSVILSSRKGRN